MNVIDAAVPEAAPAIRAASGGAPLRILKVITSACAGGLSRYILNLVRHLDQARYELHLVCTHFEGPHYEEVRPYFASTTVFSARSQIEKLTRLVPLMRRLRPDVVHAHQEPAGLIAGFLAGVPARIETIHLADYWLADGHPLLRKTAWRCATRHVVCTDYEKEAVARRTAGRKVQVIHPGLDTDAMRGYYDRESAPCSVRNLDGSFVVGTVARLDCQKGIRHLLDAAPGILQAAPGTSFLIVGDGSLRAELERQCAELGIADRVLFTGYQPDAYRFLGLMDVFVMPSLFESWGFAAAEAMAAGVPVVCTDIPGPTSFITHEQTGLLVAVSDAGAITRAVLRLCSDPVFRSRLGEAGRREVRERRNLGPFVEAYEALYRAGRSACGTRRVRD
jgi:glycosyltransferase involved in cell wall biosynthesis